MSDARGFAVIENGRLLIATVAATAVDAMSNWLDRIMPMPSGVSEGAVRRAFSQAAEMRGAELVPVTVLSERPMRRAEPQPEVEEGEY